MKKESDSFAFKIRWILFPISLIIFLVGILSWLSFEPFFSPFILSIYLLKISGFINFQINSKIFSVISVIIGIFLISSSRASFGSPPLFFTFDGVVLILLGLISFIRINPPGNEKTKK